MQRAPVAPSAADSAASCDRAASGERRRGCLQLTRFRAHAPGVKDAHPSWAGVLPDHVNRKLNDFKKHPRARPEETPVRARGKSR